MRNGLKRRGGGRPYYEIRSLRRGLEVLNVFLMSDRKSYTLGDLEQKTGLPKATLFRIVNTLVAAGYLAPVAGDAYSLGNILSELSQSMSSDLLEVRWTSIPAVDELVNETGETSYVGVLDRGEVVTVHVREGRHTLQMYSWVGRRRPAHCSALGKAILAFRSQEFIRFYLDHYELTPQTPNTITDPFAFMTHLTEIRQRGWALDNQEAELELMCVAAPIFNRFGEVCAAVSVSGPVQRLQASGVIDEVVNHVRKAAARISRMLGFWPK